MSEGSEGSQRSERTRIRVHPERAVPDESAEILVQGQVAHVGFIAGGQPFVVPMSYHFDPQAPDILYLHGSVRSRAIEQLADGQAVCVTVTLTDGLVYSRKAMNHSMNYRSVMVFGHGKLVEDEGRKFEVFDQMVQKYFPGRHVGEDYNPPPSENLGITALVEVIIDEWSGKARRGAPTGPDDNKPDALGSAGAVDLTR